MVKSAVGAAMPRASVPIAARAKERWCSSWRATRMTSRAMSIGPRSASLALLYSPLDLREETVPKTDLLQGTLDLLILRILVLGPNHGWGISNRIRQMSREGLNASQGSLYPALHRLELNGDVRSEMTASENNRRARLYTITAAGRRRLDVETQSWERFALSMKRVLQGE